MEDEDVERQLRRYRPVGPRADLRASVVAADAGRRAWREWVPAAAALALVALFYTLASRDRDAVAHYTIRSDAHLESVVSDMQAVVGGELSRPEIEWWLTRQADDRALPEEASQ